jgi:hypothetical protein
MADTRPLWESKARAAKMTKPKSEMAAQLAGMFSGYGAKWVAPVE